MRQAQKYPCGSGSIDLPSTHVPRNQRGFVSTMSKKIPSPCSCSGQGGWSFRTRARRRETEPRGWSASREVTGMSDALRARPAKVYGARAGEPHERRQRITARGGVRRRSEPRPIEVAMVHIGPPELQSALRHGEVSIAVFTHNGYLATPHQTVHSPGRERPLAGVGRPATRVARRLLRRGAVRDRQRRPDCEQEDFSER